MPSVPKPKPGQPTPVATVEGRAKGTEDAEKYVIDKVGCSGGGRRSCIESCVFSGMARKVEMLYLANFRSVVCLQFIGSGKRTSPASAR
jgi:hypothetical protein